GRAGVDANAVAGIADGHHPRGVGADVVAGHGGAGRARAFDGDAVVGIAADHVALIHVVGAVRAGRADDRPLRAARHPDAVVGIDADEVAGDDVVVGAGALDRDAVPVAGLVEAGGVARNDVALTRIIDARAVGADDVAGRAVDNRHALEPVTGERGAVEAGVG